VIRRHARLTRAEAEDQHEQLMDLLSHVQDQVRVCASGLLGQLTHPCFPLGREHGR
jgi:hypothetical protein